MKKAAEASLLGSLFNWLWPRAVATAPPPPAPPPPAPPTPPPPPPEPPSPTSYFSRCLKLVLLDEGGNDDDPQDPGGRTSRGVTQGEYSAWRLTHPGLPSDVFKAPQDQVVAIYHANYWNALHCDELPAGVDYATFDYGVNSGISRSAKLLQSVLHVGVDGIIGPLTIAAAARAEPLSLVNKLCDARMTFLHQLTLWSVYGHGWSNRVTGVRKNALVMAAAIVPLPAPKPIPPVNAPELLDLGHRVKKTMLALNYPWFDDQNTVSVEGMDPDGTVNANRHNAFDDIKMIVNGEGTIIGGPWEATTQPGRFFTDNPMASGGAFIISKGPQAIWTPGEYHGHTVWRQAEDSTIMGTRDPNGTYQRIGPPIKHGNIGVHHHGAYTNLPKDNISQAAAGCQVLRLTGNPGQQQFMNISLKCPRYLADPHGYRMTATVLSASDILT